MDWGNAPVCPPQGVQAPAIRRVYIPKPGKQEKRPLGVPTVSDRALQRSTAEVLSAIYEQDFLPCSFGGRPGRGAHHALATLNEVIAGRKVGWVLEADLKNFFGSSTTTGFSSSYNTASGTAPDQSDPALVESRGIGGKESRDPERDGGATRPARSPLQQSCRLRPPSLSRAVAMPVGARHGRRR